MISGRRERRKEEENRVEQSMRMIQEGEGRSAQGGEGKGGE